MLTLSLAFSINCFAGAKSVITLEKIEKVDMANQLMFFFDADGKVMKQEQLDEILAGRDVAITRIFKRMMSNRKMQRDLNRYIDNGEYVNKNTYEFDASEIRKAAMEEVESLGQVVFPTLQRALLSSREMVRRGVLRCMILYKDPIVLSSFSDVIYNDKTTINKFSSYCRQLVAGELVGYLDNALAQKLFQVVLTDSDFYVRSRAMNSVVISLENEDFIKMSFKRMFEYEKGSLEKKLNQYSERGFSGALAKYPELTTPLLSYFDSVSKIMPKLMQEIKVSDDILLLENFKFVFVNNSHLLPVPKREMLLKFYLEKNDVLIKTLCLRQLNQKDKIKFSELVDSIINKERNVVVLEACFKVAEKWGGETLFQSLKTLAEKDHRQKVRERAMAIITDR